ncbi:SRPBCC family protein [bacterium]|nr:SRPBCC family protein [bacterium]
MYYYTRSIEIGADLETVFAFHSDPANLLRITPRYLRISIDRHDTPAEGAEVFLRVRPFLLLPAQHWQMRFDIYEPPRRLGDVMVKGPFSAWKQVREFIPLSNGNCLLNDSVEYDLPYGTLGHLVNKLVVTRLIRGMFASRQKRTKRLLEHP